MSTNEKLTPGMTLGRYELLLPIAQGGMATVWAARQKGSRGFSKTVAIKTMLPTLSDEAQFEQMFLDEAALAAKIHHPNVAEILDLGEEDEVIYLVMEWIDGEALSVIHKQSRKSQVQIPQRTILKIVAQACAGLHAAHELADDTDEPMGLVHRDVSPQNILVTYDGVVKLVDFGVAKAMNRAGGETTAGQLKGKVPYMSPEQARGGKVDRRTDIFAMGIVLYKLTTGLHPFMGDTDIVTMRNIISRPLLPPRVKNPTFNAELEGVIVKALQKDPDRRYETMFELQQALERTLGGMGGGDEDVAGFVRMLMGERGAKRRAAIRDAVRTADEKFATGTHPKPVVHEHISEIVLTKMNTGVGEPLIERASQASLPTSMVHTTTTQTPGASTTLSEEPVSLPMERRRRGGLVAVLGLFIAAAAIAVALFFTGREPADPRERRGGNRGRRLRRPRWPRRDGAGSSVDSSSRRRPPRPTRAEALPASASTISRTRMNRTRRLSVAADISSPARARPRARRHRPTQRRARRPAPSRPSGSRPYKTRASESLTPGF